MATLEEALPGVGHVAFDFRLVLGVACPRWIDDKAPILGVFQKTSGEDRMQWVGALIDDNHAALPLPHRDMLPKL